MKSERSRWLRLDADDGWQIVVPEEDTKPHGFPEEGKAELAGLECPCSPQIDLATKIIIHNSFEDMERVDKAVEALWKPSQ